MTTIEESRSATRTRGSANLLDAWRTGPVSAGVPENELQFWAESLRAHGGKPRPPRVVVDGISAGGIRA